MIQRHKPLSEFNRNVLTLMTGTTIAQAIPIAISPILTRIYTPEDFGVLALFVAITSIFGSIANGRYELAIMLPKKDEDAINIFAVGFIITFSMSFILLVLVILFNEQITQLLKNDEISVWLYFVPIAVFFTGLYNILKYFNNRKKYYKDLANATIIKSIITAIIQLGLGSLKGGVSGLISGQLISQITANTKLFNNIIKDKLLISNVSKKKIISLAKRYNNFPKFSLWGILSNTLSQHFTNILISSFYSIATLGFYSLVQRLLGIPSILIGNSIGEVFFQEAIKEKQQTGRVINTFNSTVKKLIILGVPSFCLLFFIVEDLFAYVFGEEWRVAGFYAVILIPFYLIRFIVAPVSNTNNIFGLQKIALLWQLTLFILSVICLYLCNIYLLNFESFLKLFTYIISIHYIVLLFILWRVSKNGKL
jgi:O-antigen/teichoic acid export membrane protein